MSNREVSRILLITFVLIALFLCAFDGPHRSGDYDLKEFYDVYNRLYFDNTLPHDTIVEWGEPITNGHYVIGLTTGSKYSHPYKITVSRFFNPAVQESKETLIHEECHLDMLEKGIEDTNPHGDKWQACMKRIANRNGFWGLW